MSEQQMKLVWMPVYIFIIAYMCQVMGAGDVAKGLFMLGIGMWGLTFLMGIKSSLEAAKAEKKED